MTASGSKADEIAAALAVLAPLSVEVIDESARHAGHAGARPEGETHFRIRMHAPALAIKSRLARERAVHAALGPDLIARIHALTIEIDTRPA
ncbi:BolA family protein [Phaeovulum vinaykumarii]|uniref:BolA protein n=1 Tax=Phaeovulum vinaykumarii TaxID=407234 RepID=A0A1N7MW66_9RHOB|nr:BolA family protein [Phaeovulum vinaykumarii]SIS90109.1 BolA protein [Phaeovulum vinaykumarii]SOC16773.1 BolA protein [Phaeovulum vinaykumarii]